MGELSGPELEAFWADLGRPVEASVGYPKKVTAPKAAAPAGRRVERQLDRDTSATRKQDGGHPNRMAGSHAGMTISEHQRRH